MRASEFITETEKQYDPALIDDIKQAYDLGLTTKEMVELTGLKAGMIYYLLDKFHKNRTPRVIHAAKASTPDDVQIAINKWSEGDTINNISDSIGVDGTTIKRWLIAKFGKDAIDQEQQRRRSTGGSVHIANKITPEMRDKIRELYVTGMSADDIANAIDNIIAARNVYAAMKREPDYEELRAARDARKQKVKTGNAATTKIYRPGTIGNLRSKGPQNRHTSGVHWPKYG